MVVVAATGWLEKNTFLLKYILWWLQLWMVHPVVAVVVHVYGAPAADPVYVPNRTGCQRHAQAVELTTYSR